MGKSSSFFTGCGKKIFVATNIGEEDEWRETGGKPRGKCRRGPSEG
jgi:hypothetical protein